MPLSHLAPLRCASLLAAVIGLCACGGGGGGDDSGGSSSSGGGSSGRFSVTPTNFNLAAEYRIGSSLPYLEIAGTISGVSAQTLYLNITIAGNAVQGTPTIQITGPNTGVASIAPANHHNLLPGVYNSTITIIACTSNAACTTGRIGSPQVVNVSFTISGIGSTTSQLEYNIGDNAAPADFVRTFTAGGPTSLAWEATTDAPWLQVTPASGNATTTATVTTSLLPSEIDARANGRYTGRVRLHPAVGVNFDVPVTLTLDRTRVNYVSPYVAQAGNAGDVIIRGERLNRYPPTGVRFGSMDATTFTVVNETEIRARHPALPVGNYPVHVVNAQGFDVTRATLRVVDTPNYAATSLPYPIAAPALPFCLHYDAERRVLIAGMYPPSNSALERRIVRYAQDSGWANVGDALVGNAGACALTPDGTRLILPGSQFRDANNGYVLAVDELDPVTLQRLSRVFDPGLPPREATSVSMANNGFAILTSQLGSGLMPVSAYSPLRPEITEFRRGTSPLFTYSATSGGSGDGSVIYVGSTAGVGLMNVLRHDSALGQLVDTTLRTEVYSIVMNRNGSRAIFNMRQVYDASLALLGQLPDSTRGAALDPTLMRAYTLDATGGVRRFDVSAAASASGFPEILPSLTVGGSPAITNAWYMIATPDGRALFLAGYDRIELVPLP